MYSIYKYTNTKDGRVYIGQTCKSLEERAQSNGRNYRECRRFYKAIQEHTWSAFAPTVLETVNTAEAANERETYYISLYRSADEEYGYNIALGGDNKEMSAETKNIISCKAKERYRDKTKNPMYGKSHTDKARERQSIRKVGKNNPMYGTVWTAAQRASSGTKGKKLNLSSAQREVLSDRCALIGKTTGLKPVRCIEDETMFGSIKDAAHFYGVSKSTLCGHLSGTQKTCRGKHFEYIDKYIDLEGATTIEKVANCNN